MLKNVIVLHDLFPERILNTRVWLLETEKRRADTSTALDSMTVIVFCVFVVEMRTIEQLLTSQSQIAFIIWFTLLQVKCF